MTIGNPKIKYIVEYSLRKTALSKTYGETRQGDDGGDDDDNDKRRRTLLRR